MDSLQRVGGNLESHRRPSGRRAVLLPVEISLCEQLGITADEYWDFVANAQDAVKERPEGYDHLPDVVNDPITAIVVNLVVGIALTAVGALLAPKPKEPPKTKARLEIAGSTGRSRYTKSSNFNGVQSLAELGETIPLVFADRDKNSGGIRIDTQLLYSQMITAGTTQTLTAVMMMGAGRLGGTPDYDGFAIGDLMLRDFSEYKNQLFFSLGKANSNRLTNGIEGDQYEEGKLTTSSDNDAFSPYYPSAGRGQYKPHFSGTRTPSTRTQFGLYKPLPNGHKFMLPYELVTYPTGDDSSREVKKDSRVKIEKIIKDYPRTAGCIRNDGRETTYRISAHRLDTDRKQFDPWGLSDVLQFQDETRAQVDESIQEGQEYMLNQARAICIQRPNRTWAPELTTDLSYIFFRPPNLPGSKQIIGLSSAIDIGKGNYKESLNNPWERGCVQQLAVATLSNSRPCNATEIGIRSEVWRQIQGSANFNAHPSYKTIDKYQEKNSGIGLGTVTKYTSRYSFFRVYARELGAKSWIDITGERVFAVKGVSPEFIFNTLFIQQEQGQHEFQIVPVPGSTFYQSIQNDGIDVHLLDGRPMHKGKFAENTTGLINGYQIFYTGIHYVVSQTKAANPEWVFTFKNQNTGADDTGPIVELSAYSDENEIPLASASNKSLGVLFTTGLENKSMVIVDKETQTRTYWWEGQIKGTSNKENDFIEVKGSNDRDLQYKLISQTERPTGDNNQLILAGYGSKRTEYDIQFAGNSSPVYVYGVVKVGSTFQYWFDSRLVATTNLSTSDYFYSNNESRRYKRQGQVTTAGSSLVPDPDRQDRFSGSQRVTDNDGNEKFSAVTTGVIFNTETGQNDFYRTNNYLGSSSNRNLNHTNITYQRSSLKQSGSAAYTLVLAQTTRDVDASRGIIRNAVIKGAVRRGDPNTYQVWVDNEFLGSAEAGQTVTANGVDWLVDTRYGSSYNIGGTVYEIFNIRKQQSMPAIPDLYGISNFTRVETYDSWRISREMFTSGQSGKFYIEKLVLNEAGPVEPQVFARRLIDGSNDSAVVRLVYYQSETTPVGDAYRWSISSKGSGYRVNTNVQINGTPINIGITEIQENEAGGLKEPSYPGGNDTAANLEAFIEPGTNYSPLNAICDYFINNTDQSSHTNGPEHKIIFCNELIEQFPANTNKFTENPVPQYENLALAGIKLLNAKEWTSFNSLSAYVQRGMMVEHLFSGNKRPSGGQSENNKIIGSTHFFPEIAYYMLTDDKFGAGKLIGTQSVDKEAMTESARFCAANGFYWDGIVADNQNLREFIYQNGAFMLLDFTIKGGKFALIPSVPFNKKTYLIEKGTAPQIKALFTDGIMRNMAVSFLSPEERQPFIGVCMFRGEVKNGFPVVRTMTMRLASGSDSDPVEEFDCTGFMTSENHARQFLRYALKTREIIDHGIKFETTPQAAMSLEPGEYFRVASTTTHTDRFQSGSIDFEGNITSSLSFGENNDTTIVYWRPGQTGVSSPTNMSIREGKVSNSNLFGTLFCKASSVEETRCYKCESLTYSSDGLVEVSGSVSPLTSTGALQILDWTENDNEFVEETF